MLSRNSEAVFVWLVAYQLTEKFVGILVFEHFHEIAVNRQVAQQAAWFLGSNGSDLLGAGDCFGNQGEQVTIAAAGYHITGGVGSVTRGVEALVQIIIDGLSEGIVFVLS